MRQSFCLRNPVLAALLAASLLPTAAPAQNFDARAVDALVENGMKNWEVPGAAVVIVQDGRVIYLKGFGVAERGVKKPVTADTVFALSSCTKAFTTAALALLVDEGKLTWDDPVRKHIPFFRLADPLANENVTLRDLVSHRTGLAGHDLLWYRSPWGLEEQIRRIGKVPPSRSFRSALQYQNIMVGAAGYAGEKASGVHWNDLVQKRLLDPLGMNGTSFTTAAALQAPDHASPHRYNREGKIEVVPWYAFKDPQPALSLNASARDLGKWLKFQLGDGSWNGKRLVSSENLEETHTPQTIIRMEGIVQKENPYTTQVSYGMGWVIQDYRGHRLVSHAGNIDGMRAHITLAASDGIGLAIVCNLQDTRMNLGLSNSILDVLLGLPYRDWDDLYAGTQRAGQLAAAAQARALLAKRQIDTKPSRPLAAYVGTYEDAAYGSSRVVLEKGKLEWHWNTFRCPLEHYHFDTFSITDDVLHDPQLTFSLDSESEVVALRVLDVTFKKTPNKK